VSAFQANCSLPLSISIILTYIAMSAYRALSTYRISHYNLAKGFTRRRIIHQIKNKNCQSHNKFDTSEWVYTFFHFPSKDITRFSCNL